MCSRASVFWTQRFSATGPGLYNAHNCLTRATGRGWIGHRMPHQEGKTVNLNRALVRRYQQILQPWHGRIISENPTLSPSITFE